MDMFSGIELLFALIVIGTLMMLGIRMRIKSHTALLLAIIGLLMLALISLTEITLTLVRVLLILGIMIVLLVWLSIRRTA